jgi:hypothetical protein
MPGLIDPAREKFRDKAESLLRNMQFAKYVLGMAEGQLAETHEVNATDGPKLITVERPTKTPYYDDSPPDASPIREEGSRHVTFTESSTIPIEIWERMTPEEKEEAARRIP